MALVDKTFSQIITFTRASTATYFDSAGVLQSAAIDAPRFDYDPATLAARGFLIEEARTNLLTYSEALNTTPDWNPTRTSVTADASVAPDGNTTADALVIDTTPSTNHSIGQNESVTSGTTYTLSVFAKANQITQINLRFSAQFPAGNTFFDLSAGTLQNNGTVVASSITPVGNGWYRCTFTATANATGTAAAQIFLAEANAITITTANGTDNVLLWGAQLEAGAFPTSYIPTTTTALTRSADVASVNTLSPWFNSVQGTIYGDYQTLSAGTTQFVAAITSVSESDRMTIGQTTTAYVGAAVDTGSSQASITQGTTSVNVAKIALAYLVNDFAFSANGGAPGTDTSGTVPGNLTEMKLGRRGTSTSPLSGWLRRITYYPRRLSNVELQSITTP